MTSPTARCLAYCRKQGWPAAVVERWNQYAKVRQDFMGFADLIVLVPGAILAVQATSGANHAARVKKVRDLPAAGAWLRSGGRIAVWSWSKQGPRGMRKLWTLRTEEVCGIEMTLDVSCCSYPHRRGFLEVSS